MEQPHPKENNSALGAIVVILIVAALPFTIAAWIYGWALAAAAWHLLMKG